MNPSKCKFCRKEVKFLDHKISNEGIGALESKVVAIRDAPIPRTHTEVRSVLGLASHYTRFVKNFVKIARPLNEFVAVSSLAKTKVE